MWKREKPSSSKNDFTVSPLNQQKGINCFCSFTLCVAFCLYYRVKSSCYLPMWIVIISLWAILQILSILCKVRLKTLLLCNLLSFRQFRRTVQKRLPLLSRNRVLKRIKILSWFSAINLPLCIVLLANETLFRICEWSVPHCITLLCYSFSS